jgi:hypothetical protein
LLRIFQRTTLLNDHQALILNHQRQRALLTSLPYDILWLNQLMHLEEGTYNVRFSHQQFDQQLHHFGFLLFSLLLGSN